MPDTRLSWLIHESIRHNSFRKVKHMAPWVKYAIVAWLTVCLFLAVS